MDKPEKTVNDTGTPNCELKDDEDSNFMNNLSPITSIPTLSPVIFSDSFQSYGFTGLNQDLCSSSPLSRIEEEEEDTETVQPENDCNTPRDIIIKDSGMDLQKNVKATSKTQDYWEKLISEITEPLIYGSTPTLEPVSNEEDRIIDDGGMDLQKNVKAKNETPKDWGKYLSLNIGSKLISKITEPVISEPASCESDSSDLEELKERQHLLCIIIGRRKSEQISSQDCKKSKRLKLSIHEDTVLATRNQIEYKNPLAFSPTVIASETPTKRDCNCKSLTCMNRSCGCFRWRVGCSIRCKCVGCQNTFGRNDGKGKDHCGNKRGCNCKQSYCLKKYCPCYKWEIGCSVLCKCQECMNSFGSNYGDWKCTDGSMP